MEARLDPEVEEYALEIIEYLEIVSLEDVVLEKISDASKEFPEELILWNYCIALYLCKTNKIGQAYAMLKKINEASENHPEATYTLAVVTALLGLTDEALYNIKLSSITLDPMEELIPSWLPKFETAFFLQDSEAVFDRLRYLMHTGNYKIAYERSYDLLFAYENNPVAIALFIQIALLVNQPYNAIPYIERFMNYFNGDIPAVELMIIGDVFLALGQLPQAFSLFEEARKNFDITQITAREKRLLSNTNPAYHSIKSYYRVFNQVEKLSLEQEYCNKFLSLEAKNSKESLTENKDRNKIKLGIFINSNFNAEARLFYLSLRMQLFKNTNLLIYFYFDREKHDNDLYQYGSITKELIYVSRVDSDTLAEIIYNDGIDMMLDLSDYAIPSRIDLWRRKPAKLNILYAGDPEIAGLWGYDAVMGDKYIFPLADEKTLETGQGIIEHPKNPDKGQATILRLRKNLLQYILPEKNNIESIPDKDYVVIGVHIKKMDMTDEKIMLLRQLLQEYSDIQIMFDIVELGGEVAYQEIIEKISDGDETMQARIIATPEELELPLNLFVLYPDIILNLSPSNIFLVETTIQHHRICLCYLGETPTERVDGSILLDINPQFLNQLVFDNWQDYILMVGKLIKDKMLRKECQTMIENAAKSNHQQMSENIIINYDDISFILNKFVTQGLV